MSTLLIPQGSEFQAFLYAPIWEDHIASDTKERKYWKDYMRAYQECISSTSTLHSPWFVVPADDKDTARLIVSQIVINGLTDLKMSKAMRKVGGNYNRYAKSYPASVGPAGDIPCRARRHLRIGSGILAGAALATVMWCVFGLAVGLGPVFWPLIAERTFWLYGGVAILAWVFCCMLVPQTKGKTLEQIEAHWRETA